MRVQPMRRHHLIAGRDNLDEAAARARRKRLQEALGAIDGEGKIAALQHGAVEREIEPVDDPIVQPDGEPHERLKLRAAGTKHDGTRRILRRTSGLGEGEPAEKGRIPGGRERGAE